MCDFCVLMHFFRFRLVALQLSELQDCLNEYEVTDQLQCVPKGLDEIYDQIMLRISKTHHYEDALKILQWLAFSACTLQLDEIAEVVCVAFNGNQEPYFDPSDQYKGPQSVLHICPGLISCCAGKINLYSILKCTDKQYRKCYIGTSVCQGVSAL